MWLEAIVTAEDLTGLMREILPVKVHLSPPAAEGDEKKAPERWLMLQAATKVELVAEQGLRVTCPAELRWSFAGMSPTVKLDELSVLFRIQVVEKHKGHVLELQIEVDEADFHCFPQFVDATIVKAVNV